MEFNAQEIVELIYNGNIELAKERLQRGCKTNPERQAYRLGVIIMNLHRPHPEWYRAEAYRFLSLFDK